MAGSGKTTGDSVADSDAGYDQDGRGPRPADDRDDKVMDAISDGLSAGFRRYLPPFLGVMLLGVACCALASYAHFVLGISLKRITLGGGGGLGFGALWAALRR